MIEHPEDYSGPSLPCGDLTGAPVGAGEAHRPSVDDVAGVAACALCGADPDDGCPHEGSGRPLPASCPVAAAVRAAAGAEAAKHPPGSMVWGLDVAHGVSATAGMGYYDPEWQRKSIPVPCVPCGGRCHKDPRPPGGWSDCGPAA